MSGLLGYSKKKECEKVTTPKSNLGINYASNSRYISFLTRVET